MSEGRQHGRLPRNFHKTFKPERQYIAGMLRFASIDGSADYQGIAAATGIPTGTSSGKVPAILDYCRGMGLVTLKGPERSSVKKPELTWFGRIVLLEDPFLKLEVSQWIAHLNLCSPISGADAWYLTFFVGMHSLGMAFERAALEAHLSLAYATEKGGLIGPLVSMYEDEASFKVCGALSAISATVQRKKAPVTEGMAWGYGAWTLHLIETHFPRVRQIPITDLERLAGWRSIPSWDAANAQRALEMMVRRGILEVDRHMEPWIVSPVMGAEQAWKRIYEDQL